jgi:hypothetical protein
MATTVSRNSTHEQHRPLWTTDTYTKRRTPVPGKLTNLQLKDYATHLIERAIVEIDHATIVRWAEAYVAGGAITDFDAHLVEELIDRSIVTVSWSEAD